ncbi:energy-coupling factor ABC transporter permease [Sporolituus thermophilus]|uniref:Cobalt transport protein CbiM n=1 Tax=Sporolituus thermophilus DSM 23256 TaxID=1123285 RepID=A0A1G7HRI7_9FIRM|nr:energy-coupling factor ABC transporter permease [Sporolituus thermophilus]SDF03050.1 cobalt/nickel transport system permease protein [Sporolituus thermophilus DSM 23256]
MKAIGLVGYFLVIGVIAPAVAHAMHIMEGFLPQEQAIIWLAAVTPCLAVGVRRIRGLLAVHPERKMILGLAAAFIFVLSALKIPSVTGSSSHPTGVGLSAVLFGPAVSSVLSGIVLLFQALLLAHGGLTTWGANTFAMGVAGAFVAWGIFKIACRVGLSEKLAIFLAAMLGDWATYLVTAGQLALAFPDAVGGFWAAYAKFLSIFAFTQLPLAVSEGILSVVVYNTLTRYNALGLIDLWWNERRNNA